MDICFDIYVTNGQNKQNLADLQFLLNYALFCKHLCRKLLKKPLEYESILYNSTELSVDSGHPWIFKIKLYYFQERSSLRYNIILKLLSLFHICSYVSYMFFFRMVHNKKLFRRSSVDFWTFFERSNMQ